MAVEAGLFEGLPPPSGTKQPNSTTDAPQPPPPQSPPPPSPAAPALRSALKRDKATDNHCQAHQKRLRFKTTVDATETQIIDAMQKIALHIKNPSKFIKASKLVLQLIEAGSVKSGTSNHFFAILEAAMSSSACTDPSLRTDYHVIFSAAQDVAEFFTKQQQNRLATWVIKAVIANDLHTDDSFVFSKTAGKIKVAISSLPLATTDDDHDEAESLANAEIGEAVSDDNERLSVPSVKPPLVEDDGDPFGLDSLLSNTSKKDDKVREKDVATLNRDTEEKEYKRFIKSQREALLFCLEIAAKRYKLPWCQTVVDILVRHAFDNLDKFTAKQRDAIEKLWASVREQHIRRKQGKSVSGKLDVNAFEWLQEKYSHVKISIRHAVGGDGERRAEQWLG